MYCISLTAEFGSYFRGDRLACLCNDVNSIKYATTRATVLATDVVCPIIMSHV